MYYLKSYYWKIVSQKIPVSWETYLESSSYFVCVFRQATQVALYVNRHEKNFFVLQVCDRIYEYHNLAKAIHHMMKLLFLSGNKINIFNLVVYRIKKANLPCLQRNESCKS